MKCPVCKKEVEFSAPNMPFCSDRCRLLDLGDWASEKFVISTPIRRNELGNELEFEDDILFPQPGRSSR
jgi:endogenous inhibitor of DNA gyrase (YacG/DUF329 family)